MVIAINFQFNRVFVRLFPVVNEVGKMQGCRERFLILLKGAAGTSLDGCYFCYGLVDQHLFTISIRILPQMGSQPSLHCLVKSSMF